MPERLLRGYQFPEKSDLTMVISLGFHQFTGTRLQ